MDITKQVKTDLITLIKENLSAWQEYIEPCCNNEDCECRTNCLTVGLNNAGDSWSYQTGDNSFTGGAYGMPNWAVVHFSRETTPEELIEDLMTDIEWIEVY